MNTKGFTLIETLVSGIVILLLILLVVSAFNDYRLEECSKGDNNACEKLHITKKEAQTKLIKEKIKNTTPLDDCRKDCARDITKNLEDCLTRCKIIYE
jgi:competence protein ComGC